MDIAIVTGASSGLGREYVKLLDDEGLDEIWLVARRRPQLEDLAGALKTKSRLYPLDLTENGSFRILQQALTDSRAIVRYLIHAAGFGKMGSVMTIPSGVQEKMVDLNDRAAISLVQLVLPYCKAGSHLVQICSCAAFLPIPELAVYSATKAFLLRYSRGLAYELAPQGIQVTAVCPYWIKDTEFIGVAQQTDTRHLFTGFPLASTAAQVAHRSLRAAKNCITVCTPDVMSFLHRICCTLLPHRFVMAASVLFHKLHH